MDLYIGTHFIYSCAKPACTLTHAEVQHARGKGDYFVKCHVFDVLISYMYMRFLAGTYMLYCQSSARTLCHAAAACRPNADNIKTQ